LKADFNLFFSLLHPNNGLENISMLYLPLFSTVEKNCPYAVSPHGRTNKGNALDRKPGARTLILPLTVWAAKPRTTDSRGERLANRPLPKQ